MTELLLEALGLVASFFVARSFLITTASSDQCRICYQLHDVKQSTAVNKRCKGRNHSSQYYNYVTEFEKVLNFQSELNYQQFILNFCVCTATNPEVKKIYANFHCAGLVLDHRRNNPYLPSCYWKLPGSTNQVESFGINTCQIQLQAKKQPNNQDCYFRHTI